jgi:hypothetical protein
MNIKQILTAAITGTTCMTLFSEAVSKVKGDEFNEARILGEMLERVTPLQKDQAHVAGWAGHYAVGTVFASLYHSYLKASGARPNMINGLVFGTLSGLAGAAIWHTTFKAHPNPPGVNLKSYYKQLVIAHAVFGAAASLTYPAKK